MQALVLAGGEGTRLRPLTSTVPKPVVPLVDRPLIAFMLEWLHRHGVDDVVLSCGYLAAGMRNVLGDGAAFGVRLRYIEEPEPLGTGGALKLAEPLLEERFFMLNGDTLTDLDLTAQLARHEEAGAMATLGLIAVEDPSAYGLVRIAPDGGVLAFLEKPSPDQIDTDLISGGIYVLEREVLARMPAEGPCSIERDVFPRLIGRGLLGVPSRAYWLDIGTPARYLQGTFDILEGEVQTAVGARMGSGYQVVEDETEIAGRVIPPALVQRGCRIGAGARVGARVVLGPDVAIGPGAVVEQSVVLGGAEIGAETHVAGCIVGPGARIGARCTLREGAVLGEGVTLGDGNELRAGARLFPGVSLPDEAIRFLSTLPSITRARLGEVDVGRLVDDVLAMPDHLRDALWRVESAQLQPHDAPGGMVVAGMGGSAIGGELAVAALGDRASRPIAAARSYGLPSWATPDTTVLCSSYSGNTEETLAAYEAAGHLGARRIVATTGGRLAEQARADAVPVIPLPAALAPRSAVAYMTVAALEVAALCGAGERLHTEIDVAAASTARLAAEWGPDGDEDNLAQELARALLHTVPVIAGAGPTIPIAYRWKTQLNENAKVPAFSHELPELDHNEICGWSGAAGVGSFSAVFLDDSDLHPRERQRIELTRGLIASEATSTFRVDSRGETRTERVFSLVLLGDLMSVYLAVLRGVDPTPVEVLDRLKAELGRS